MTPEAMDRRANPRIPAVFDVQGTPDESGVVARMEARALSIGGLRCTSNSDFPEMTRLAVRLQLPMNGDNNIAPVDVEAVVVRRIEMASATQDAPRYELALFFTSLDDDAKRRIDQYLDR